MTSKRVEMCRGWKAESVDVDDGKGMLMASRVIGWGQSVGGEGVDSGNIDSVKCDAWILKSTYFISPGRPLMIGRSSDYEKILRVI